MKKSLIALAIVAALPVAAQADPTISGSVTTKISSTGAVDSDATLKIDTSEVLDNGMTVTATLDIFGGTNQGTATLTGDFGTITAGKIDADGAFQAGDVGEVVANTMINATTASSVYGVHYAGTAAGLSVAAQVNGNTAPNGAVVAFAKADEHSATVSAIGAETKSTQLSATYDFNGLTVGYAYASAEADVNNSTTAGYAGVDQGMSAFGVSYSFGDDLVVTAGKQTNKASTSTSPGAIVSATYTMTVDALTVKTQMDNTPSGDYQIDLTYALTNAVTLTSEIDSTAGKDTTLVATYVAGDMTASVSKTDDGTTDASIALDYGNADLTLARVGKTDTVAAYTKVTYKVAF